jgi:hypothetical protein
MCLILASYVTSCGQILTKMFKAGVKMIEVSASLSAKK